MATKQELKKELSRQVQEDIKLEVVSRKNQREGLCKDCVRAEACSLSHNTNDVIWDCEDYSEEAIVQVKAATQNLFSNETKTQKARSTNPGLCAYCSYSENCSLKSVDGGIWHCAEYA